MSYYVRVRGRVQGPFQVEQLRALIQKGQLSRIHELSQDQQSWSKVADFPELFAAPAIEQAPSAAASYAQPDVYQQPQYSAPQPQYTAPQAQDPRTAHPQQNAAGSAEPMWHYSQHGSQMGPVPQATLQQLLATGQLSPESQVWTQGMGDWVRARQIPQFANLGGSQNYYAAPQTTGYAASPAASMGEKVSPALVHSVSGTWLWLLFAVLYLYILQLVLLVYCFGGMIVAARVKVAYFPVFQWLLSFAIVSLPITISAIFAHRYLNSIGRFSRMPTDFMLLKVQDCARQFWIVIGIFSLLGFLFVLIGFLYFIAMGMDLFFLLNRTS